MKSNKIELEVIPTGGKCPIGELVSKENIKNGKIPVLSCEGGCIRGEIARLAANLVSKDERFARGCHGELFTIPDSGITNWMTNAKKVVLIDGCFLKCHKRIMKNLIDEDKLIHFDALSHYKKYTDIFDIDDVPENERKKVARDVADWVLKSI